MQTTKKQQVRLVCSLFLSVLDKLGKKTILLEGVPIRSL